MARKLRRNKPGAGRPLSGPEPLDEPLRIMVGKSDKERLAKAAGESKQTVGAIVRQFIREGLARLAQRPKARRPGK